jgi:hypothetical protein
MVVSAYTRPFFFGHCLAVFAIGLLAGCEGPSPQVDSLPAAPKAAGASKAAATPPGSAASTPAAQPAAASGEKPISDAEAQEFAKSLKTLLKSSDRAAIDAAFDYDKMLDRILQGIQGRIRHDLIAGTKPNLTGPASFGTRTVNGVAQGQRYSVLHAHRERDEQYVLCRITKVGIDYVDYILVRSDEGKIKIGDVCNYRREGRESEIVRQECICAAARETPQFIKQLSPADKEYVTFESSILHMGELITNNRAKEALDIYQRFPDVLKNHRLVLREHVDACCSLDANCDETVRAYRAAFPDDLGVELALLPYYYRNHRFDDYLACVERLDKAVGGDPYLNANRCLAYFEKGDLTAAKKCAQLAAAAEPDEPVTRECLKMVTDAEHSPSANRPVGSVNLTEPSRGEPAGEAEAKTFAETFAKNMIAGDAEAVRAAIDIPAIYQRATAGISVPQEGRAAMEPVFPGFMESMISRFAASSGTLAENGGSFQFLRLHRAGDEQRAMFRIIEPGEGPDYVDCVLVRHANGKVRIDDFYLFKESLLISQFARRFALFALEQAAKPPQAAAGRASGDNAAFFSAGGQLSKLRKDGKYQAAMDLYETLPESVKKDKLFLIDRIDTAKHLKGKPYDDAIRAYRTAFPNGPNLDLIMIDGYLEHKLYDRALACIDRLDKTVGGDPYLDATRANVYRLKGDRVNAKKLGNKAAAAEPNLSPAYECLLAVSLTEKKFSETSRLLTLFKKKFPKRMPDLKGDPAYAEYAKSAAYRTWLKTQ